LRTGRELLRISGLMREDNDLVVIENAEVAAAFKHNFEERFASGDILAQGMASEIKRSVAG